MPEQPPNVLTEMRATLVEHLTGDVLDLPDSRIHPFPPAQLVTPCVFVDMPTVSSVPAGMRVAWSIYAAFDGADVAQTERMEYVGARMWDVLDAAEDGLACNLLTPGQVDTGGAPARAARLDLSWTYPTGVLCPDWPVADAPAPTPRDTHEEGNDDGTP